MKSMLNPFLATLLCLAGNSHSELLLHYKFDDSPATTNCTDSSGNGITGLFQQNGVGATLLQTGTGVSGQGGDYAYDGTAANGMGTNGTWACRIKYGGGGFNSSSSSLTVCGWFKTQSGPIANSARLLAGVGTENILLFEAAGNGLRFQLGSAYVDSGANTFTNAGVWTFFAVTYDSTISSGNNVHFWIGDSNTLSLVSSKTLAGAGTWDGLGAAADFSIGNRQGTTAANNMDRPFDGYIDDFRIYGATTGSSGALSQTELDTARIEAVHRPVHLTVPPVTNPFPRLLISTNQLAAMKERITNQTEPYYAAWTVLKSSTNDIMARSPIPYTGTDTDSFYTQAGQDGVRVCKLALAYHGTGDTNCLNKAVDFLHTWATSTPLPGTQLTGPGDPGMMISRGTILFLTAYDLVQPNLTATQNANISNWFKSLVPSIKASITDWKTNDYYNGQLYQNHLVAHTLGCTLIGYATGDRDLVQFALDSVQNDRDMCELITGTILCANDTTQLIRGDTANYPPQAGEIYDRYRHYWHTEISPTNRGTQEKGLQYADLSMRLLCITAEAAYQNGIDFYSFCGSNGENLEQCFEFYSDFVRTTNSAIKGGFYAGVHEDAVLQAGASRSMSYEIANMRYPGNPHIERLLGSIDRAAMQVNNDWGVHLCFPVLTHGADLINRPIYSLGEFNNTNDGWVCGGILNISTNATNLSGYQQNDNARLYRTNLAELNIALTNYTRIEVTMMVETGSTGNANIYWGTADNPEFNGTLRRADFAVKAPGTYQLYEIDMSEETNWTGILNDIRLDPVNGYTNQNKYFWIDSIRLIPNEMNYPIYY